MTDPKKSQPTPPAAKAPERDDLTAARATLAAAQADYDRLVRLSKRPVGGARRVPGETPAAAAARRTAADTAAAERTAELTAALKAKRTAVAAVEAILLNRPAPATLKEVDG